MRPVNKGDAPKAYTDYGKARHDLANIIGYYCSYCEMKVYNSIEVEHILPKNQGGAPLNWSNFLLSCKYCNTIKSDHNQNLSDYLWPDLDNTDLAFIYSESDTIEPNANCSAQIQTLAQNCIDLMGLNRYPGGPNQPTFADTRWRSRKEAWDLAHESYNDWMEAPINAMARSIAKISLNGHYSIWMEVFKNEPVVIGEIDNLYRKKGLFKKYNANGTRTVRAGANI
ncbi:HNH endonuclease [Halosquirtibacter laminarini]|uniref:HNH endonuclease n=1 Tax=Halosquirtibacter laminarini TaxID=3374600 RepID=A0AC61NQ57_9BACT|nr:HNH endonuclease [Prolixibacteraceae bacterium]